MTRAQELRRVASAPVTPRAPTVEELGAQLDEIIASGWTMSFGEREEGLAAAAVPIRNHADEVVAALSISGPSARLTDERLESLRPELTGAANEISRALGWTQAHREPVGLLSRR
jgi:DNA-binding IclR family transcriptional regulator